MSVITAEQLGKIYDDGTQALSHLDLEVREGEIFGLLGPNGAGKTTTVRLLNGTIRPTEGRVEVLGYESGSEEIRAKTSTVAEQASLYEYLTVDENLAFFGALYGMSSSRIDARTDEILAALDISDRRTTKVGSLSTGLKKRVQIARALLHRPRLMFLDEPTSGLDPESARDVVGLVESLAKHEGTTVLLCTHNLPLAERICTGYGFLVEGKLAWSGSRSDLLQLDDRRSVLVSTTEGTSEHPIQDETDINGVIRDVMQTGVSITEVRMTKPTLEESYFKIVNGGNNELPS